MTRESLEVVYEDGQLAIKWTTSSYNKPEIVSNYWGFGPAYRPTVEYLIGKPVRDLGGGRYEITHTGDGFTAQRQVLRLPDGGATKSFKVIVTPYPCPKVRRGIPTRYEYGVWRKYTKKEGWTAI